MFELLSFLGLGQVNDGLLEFLPSAWHANVSCCGRVALLGFTLVICLTSWTWVRSWWGFVASQLTRLLFLIFLTRLQGKIIRLGFSHCCKLIFSDSYWCNWSSLLLNGAVFWACVLVEFDRRASVGLFGYRALWRAWHSTTAVQLVRDLFVLFVNKLPYNVATSSSGASGTLLLAVSLLIWC